MFGNEIVTLHRGETREGGRRSNTIIRLWKVSVLFSGCALVRLICQPNSADVTFEVVIVYELPVCEYALSAGVTLTIDSVTSTSEEIVQSLL